MINVHQPENDAEAHALKAVLKEHNIDGLVTTRKRHYFVIPVETGIQYFQWVTGVLDTRFRGYD
jgi:hypothetical protein